MFLHCGPYIKHSFYQGKHAEGHLRPLPTQWEKHVSATLEGSSDMKVGLYLSYCLYGMINAPHKGTS